MANLNDIISVKQLPALPASVAQLLPILADDRCDLREAERLIRRDEGLSASVLRAANSAAYSRGNRTHQLLPAITRLGARAIRKIILSAQVGRMLDNENRAYGLQRGELWRSALGGALAAESLARDQAKADPELCFIGALLRDIGKLAMDRYYGARYGDLIAPHVSEGCSYLEAERRALGFDHAEVGAALVANWNLPEPVAHAVRWHHEPPCDARRRPATDVVHAADIICLWAGLGAGDDGLRYRLAPHVRDELGLNPAAAQRWIAEMWSELSDNELDMTPKGAAA